ncbi:MAG: aldo/keto reductase [Gammaproteobacteria bacterium]|nr:aldo/keto reductase [Gammaproteobacteria bacterium]
MKYRQFGKTDMQVSEVGFGAWAIGGKSFGQVEKKDSLAALAKAEELGCNFVDTAAVYGDSEAILGQFLQSRRNKWYLATKYSGQQQGMTATLEEQLRTLKTDYIDFYQIHWAPGKRDHNLYDELHALKQAGKVRYVGVSLNNILEIDYVLEKTFVDGFQAPFSLLDPYPLLRRIDKVKKHNVGVIVRSCLHYGFLTGKYNETSTFTDSNDQRAQWPQQKIRKTVAMAEQFRFLEQHAGSITLAAAQYPLSYPEVTTVIMSTKNETQAITNFGEVPSAGLSTSDLEEVIKVQKRLGLTAIPFKKRMREMLSEIRQKLL